MICIGGEVLNGVEFGHTAELSSQTECATMIGALQSLGVRWFSADQHPSMRADIGDTMHITLTLCQQHRFSQWIVDGLGFGQLTTVGSEMPILTKR